MLGRSRGLGMALAAAMLVGSMGAATLAQPAPMVTQNAPRRAKKGLFGGVSMTPQTRWGYRGPGTTAAQIKRASKKARNVRRHKGNA